MRRGCGWDGTAERLTGQNCGSYPFSHLLCVGEHLLVAVVKGEVGVVEDVAVRSSREAGMGGWVEE